MFQIFQQQIYRLTLFLAVFVGIVLKEDCSFLIFSSELTRKRGERKAKVNAALIFFFSIYIIYEKIGIYLQKLNLLLTNTYAMSVLVQLHRHFVLER